MVNSTNETLDDQCKTCVQLLTAGGAGLRAECKDIGTCRAGEVRVTRGHNLPARLFEPWNFGA